MKLKIDDETNSVLKPLYTLGFRFESSSSNQAVTDCPFCGKIKHFYINRKTGLWDCKKCGLEGNIEQFLSYYARQFFEETEEKDYASLVRATGLPAKIFKYWSIGYNGKYFLLHNRCSKDRVNNITLFDSNGKFRKPLWGLPVQLYGKYKVRQRNPQIIWIAEGHKDCLTLSWLLRSSPKEYAVGVPGAETFKPEWVYLFRNKDVILCYDNDKPGQNGTRKAIGLLSNVVKSIKVLNWPKSKKDGYDITDYYKDLKKKYKFSSTILNKIKNLLKPSEDVEWIGEIKPEPIYEVMVRPLSDYEPEIMEFHWSGRIPYCAITLFYGLAGQNKSSVALYIAAITSKGLSWPDGYGKAPQGTILYIGCEDPVGSVIRPRFEAMGGDVNKLIILEGIKLEGEKEWLDLSKHLPAIEDYIKTVPDLKLIIIDPFNAFLGWSKNPWDDERIRRIVGPVHQLAERYKLAVIGILHANKNEKQNLVHRISGSAAWGNLARSLYVFGTDQNDAGRKFMSPTKMSYGLEEPTLAFRVVQKDSDDVNAITLDFEETPIQQTAEELFSRIKEGKQKPGPAPKSLDEAKEFLTEKLRKGMLPLSMIKSLAEMSNITLPTLYRAKKEMEIKTVKPKKGLYKRHLCWQKLSR